MPFTALTHTTKLLNLIFPSRCPICDKPSDSHMTSPLCSSCWETIELHEGGGCRTCAAVTDYDSTGVCQECRAVKPSFDRVIAFGIYDGVLKEAIRLMKFRRIKRFARVIGYQLSRLTMPVADLVIPVPLSIQGLRDREFNQSALIAKVLSKETSIPLYLEGLIKVKETQSQSSLAKKERISNVRGAYRANERVEGKRILLVDDVVTTSATINECARILKKAGARSVTAITAARARND